MPPYSLTCMSKVSFSGRCGVSRIFALAAAARTEPRGACMDRPPAAVFEERWHGCVTVHAERGGDPLASCRTSIVCVYVCVYWVTLVMTWRHPGSDSRFAAVTRRVLGTLLYAQADNGFSEIVDRLACCSCICRRQSVAIIFIFYSPSW